eukprot:s631_g3.t1
MDGWGDSEDDEIDSTQADPFIYTAGDSQVLVVPSVMKQVNLPGVGKKGGCGDWQIKTVKETKAADGTTKFILESKGGTAASRYLDSVLNSKFAQALHGINFSGEMSDQVDPGHVLEPATPVPKAPAAPRDDTEQKAKPEEKQPERAEATE